MIECKFWDLKTPHKLDLWRLYIVWATDVPIVIVKSQLEHSFCFTLGMITIAHSSFLTKLALDEDPSPVENDSDLKML